MITIHLTDKTLNKAVMKEYNKTHGIYCAPLYVVPTYLMLVDVPGFGELHFEVIRAGPNRSLAHYPKRARRCRYGIFRKHRLQLAAGWHNTYSPRTIGATELGAVRLWKGKGYLIHEGPPDRQTAMGTAGCVEIFGEQNWKNFVNLVKPWGQQGKVQFKADPIVRPVAPLVFTQPSIYRRCSHALYRNWKNSGRTEYELREKDVDRIIEGAKKHRGVSVDEGLQLVLIYLNYSMPEAASKKFAEFINQWASVHTGKTPSARRRGGRGASN